jgi:hypothetical protein
MKSILLFLLVKIHETLNKLSSHLNNVPVFKKEWIISFPSQKVNVKLLLLKLTKLQLLNFSNLNFSHFLFNYYLVGLFLFNLASI